MKNRITPDNITSLQPNEIFVFGSNVKGRHGKGAAKTAMQWGAKYGQGEGLQGRTYGIPTIQSPGIQNKISIERIKPYINRFIEFAKNHPELTFLVTEIGCGLAYHTVKEIAPLFKEAVAIENIHLPAHFWHKLKLGKDKE
jgi:hypothetical protein